MWLVCDAILRTSKKCTPSHPSLPTSLQNLALRPACLNHILSPKGRPSSKHQPLALLAHSRAEGAWLQLLMQCRGILQQQSPGRGENLVPRAATLSYLKLPFSANHYDTCQETRKYETGERNKAVDRTALEEAQTLHLPEKDLKSP